MQSYDCFNVCSLTAVSALKPTFLSPIGQKPVNDLAKRLHRDYGVTLWVANDIVTRYSPAEIEAAIALRERRNGAIYNEAGFIVYLLGNGFARNYVRARLQARQRSRPKPKPHDEPDLAAIVTALREALAPYGIPVADDCAVELPNGRLRPFLDGDPETVVARTLDLMRRHGFLRDGNGQDSAEPADQDAFADATDALWALDADQCPTEADANPADYQPDPPDDDSGDDDEGEPLPPPACELCGRSEGEPHPALQSWQRNDFLCLSELSDAFKQRFGLPEAGLLCRGCYVTLGLRLVGTSDPDGNGQATDQPTTDEGFRAADDLHDDLHDALADASPYQPELKAMAWAAD